VSYCEDGNVLTIVHSSRNRIEEGPLNGP